MLRSLIAHVFILIALAVIPLACPQSARAATPLEAWLRVAADSLDQQIAQQMQLPWQALDLMGQRTAERFDRVMDQCRMGAGGTRGMQLVRVIDLLVELRESGVTGVVAPAKNWNFPAEHFVLQRRKIVQENSRSSQVRGCKAAAPPISTAVIMKASVLLEQIITDRRFFPTALARLATQTNTTADRLAAAVCDPAEPLVQAARQAWDQLVVASADQKRAGLSDLSVEKPKKSTLSQASVKTQTSVLVRDWLEVSHSAQAKLNWLTSKVRHIAEACLKRIEPEFLILKVKPLA